MAYFTPALAQVAGANGGHNGKGKPKSNPRSDIRKLQRVALTDATNPDTNPSVKAALMRAYVDLQELKMNLEGVGKPRPVIAKNDQPKRRTRAQGPLGDAVSKVPGSSVSGPGTDKPVA
ncbi:MAG: hypothetical protein V4563_14875 [Pseudomonadota bacterium]